MVTPEGFERDREHWLLRLSPDEWIQAAIGELERARTSLEGRNAPAAIAGLKRAAGMAINGALIILPNESWGRTYVEHLAALALDEAAPEAVRRAARRLSELQAPGGSMVSLRTKREDRELLDAAETVMAHAYAIVHGSVGRRSGDG